MIVEFTGCSGAGKTSLVRRVREILRKNDQHVSEPFEQFLPGNPLFRAWHSRCLNSTSVANLTVELLGWPHIPSARSRLSASDAWVRKRIREVAQSRREWIRLSRSWNRKLVTANQMDTRDETLAGKTLDLRTLLNDEGLVHFATTLLARSTGDLGRLLDQYLERVPLPDQIVCVSASGEQRAQRLSTRRMRPAPDRKGLARYCFLERSRETIERMCVHPLVAPRLIRVHNDSVTPGSLDRLASVVIHRLISRRGGLEGATPLGEGSRPVPTNRVA